MPTQQLARACVQVLTPYQSARRIGGHGNIWLNANESPDSDDYSLAHLRLNRYPEFQPPELISAYAEYAGVEEEQVLATRGADEAIDLLIRTYCEPGQDQIVINPPTYGMYAISAQTFGVDVIKQPLDDDFNPDYQALNQVNAKIIFICSPNNPTGNLVSIAALRTLAQAQQNKAIIAIDEAYIEFSPQASASALINEFDNIVIFRTLSKAFALAGGRCGFILAPNEIIRMLAKVIAPYPVPSLVASVATKVLTQEMSAMQQRVTESNRLRTEFIKQIDSLKIADTIFSATGNFILVQFKADLFDCIAQRGIVLRNFADKPRLERAIRITIGSPQEMEQTIAAIKELSQTRIGEACQ
ncbi:histidinol-phosphate transaminase [Celerinatantimonas diazotrophica]|uniref:Histidinol-phosphate aminotransferase n=1 Tax=Celerinatantimonas diazotrophica TaxID=412034 RepID=A0A4R1JBT0_9GAMM|nr:histidinol-phosphate transaminase [Celerinatantimonas diazotrophica]TCK47609.1 histidinol-phosphate aminotransferase [Celerinatantimonas diazotrophica]CAG9296768.1 Histidinol-phosphate aminotransferase [Celerinatantimonas diazotrophica]